jgi:hypothetical protein
MRDRLRKASNRAQEARSGVGLGKGSHQPVQSLVGLLIRCVQIPNERLGFVQPGWVLAMSRWGGGGVGMAGRGKTTLCPSPLAPVGRGPLPIFPDYFLAGVYLLP